ncbi:MAG: peptidoglycan-binding domain-containing protein [Bradyrhizobium sp.]
MNYPVRRLVAVFGLLVLSLTAGSTSALADRRVALVIGNINAKASLMPFLMAGMGGVKADPGKAADYGLEALHGGSPVARGLLIDKWNTSLTPPLRKAVEQRLARAGLLNRTPDGRYGPDTLAALQAFILAK